MYAPIIDLCGDFTLRNFFLLLEKKNCSERVKPCSLCSCVISSLESPLSLLLLSVFWIFFARFFWKKKIDFPKKLNRETIALLSCRFASYINALNTHTKQNGPFDAIRHFSWQANYFREGFFQTVRLRSRDVVLYWITRGAISFFLRFFFWPNIRSTGLISMTVLCVYV